MCYWPPLMVICQWPFNLQCMALQHMIVMVLQPMCQPVLEMVLHPLPQPVLEMVLQPPPQPHLGTKAQQHQPNMGTTVHQHQPNLGTKAHQHQPNLGITAHQHQPNLGIIPAAHQPQKVGDRLKTVHSNEVWSLKLWGSNVLSWYPHYTTKTRYSCELAVDFTRISSAV